MAAVGCSSREAPRVVVVLHMAPTRWLAVPSQLHTQPAPSTHAQAALHFFVSFFLCAAHQPCCDLHAGCPNLLCCPAIPPGARSALTSGMTLTLSPCKPAGKRKDAPEGGTIEQIEKASAGAAVGWAPLPSAVGGPTCDRAALRMKWWSRLGSGGMHWPMPTTAELRSELRSAGSNEAERCACDQADDTSSLRLASSPTRTHPLLLPLHCLPQIVHVRQPGSLEMRPRSVRQLSGEWRGRPHCGAPLGRVEAGLALGDAAEPPARPPAHSPAHATRCRRRAAARGARSGARV